MQRWNSLLKALLIDNEAPANSDLGKDKIVCTKSEAFAIITELDAPGCERNTLPICRESKIPFCNLVHSVRG